MISVSSLYKSFSRIPLFENYSLTLNSRRSCIQAPNGGGKTTLLMILAGLEKYSKGEILYDGKLISNPGRCVAIATDRVTVPEFLTLRQMLELVAASWRCEWPAHLIAAFQLERFLDISWPALSSGNMKKGRLVAAMMRQTPYLLLDEPGNALDETGHLALMSLLDDYPGQVVITSHEPGPYLAHGFELMDLRPC